MRADHGYFSANAIDIGLVYPPSIMSLIHTKIPKHILPSVALSGKRFTGPSVL